MDKTMIVEEVFATDNVEYQCLVTINNFSNKRDNVVVGENLTSNVISMLFPKSVGESKWKLVFYPKGQYINEKVGKFVAIYLVMLSCENANTSLTAKVSFQLISNNDKHGPIKDVNTEFDYSIPSKRSVGEPNFCRKSYLNSELCKHFFDHNALIISCTVKEICPEIDTIEKNLKSICYGSTEEDDSHSGSPKGYNSVDDDRNKNGNEIQKNNDTEWQTVSHKNKNKQQKNKHNIESSKAKSSVLHNYADNIFIS